MFLPSRDLWLVSAYGRTRTLVFVTEVVEGMFVIIERELSGGFPVPGPPVSWDLYLWRRLDDDA